MEEERREENLLSKDSNGETALVQHKGGSEGHCHSISHRRVKLSPGDCKNIPRRRCLSLAKLNC